MFGGTGDLALRKLLPSLFLRDKAGQITATSRIIGVSRSQMSPADYKAKAEQALRRHLHKDEFDEKTWERFGADRLRRRRRHPRPTAGISFRSG